MMEVMRRTLMFGACAPLSSGGFWKQKQWNQSLRPSDYTPASGRAVRSFGLSFYRMRERMPLPGPGTAKSGYAGLRWEGFAVDERRRFARGANNPPFAMKPRR